MAWLDAAGAADGAAVRAREHPVLGEQLSDAIPLGVVEECRVLDDEIVDREAVLESLDAVFQRVGHDGIVL